MISAHDKGKFDLDLKLGSGCDSGPGSGSDYAVFKLISGIVVSNSLLPRSLQPRAARSRPIVQ